MNITCTHEEETLILFINGEAQTYTKDKVGKRQAILAGLAALEPVLVGDTRYLSSTAALQVVAAVLYADGIQSEAAYQTVCQVTARACAHLGYGAEVELVPPAVPFAARGSYRQQYPPVAAAVIQEALTQAGTSYRQPQQEIACRIVWNQVGLRLWQRRWSQLTPAEQNYIQTQVDACVQAAGWQKADEQYSQPLPIDEAAARHRLRQLLARQAGQPVSVSQVHTQVEVGAYGRHFYEALAPALQAIVTDVLQATGYQPIPEDGMYQPLPLTLAPAVVATLAERITAVSPVMTQAGPALPLSGVLAQVTDCSLSQWQMEQLVAAGPLSRVLRQLGYQTAVTWCQPNQFRPPLAGHEAHPVLFKVVQVPQDPDRKITLADGFPVYVPALTLDETENTLVYLEMVGAKQAVKANWAALVGAGKRHWLGGQFIALEGMKAHVKIQTALPCGWVSQVLLHKQASLKEMNPEQPFYLLDEDTQPIPPLFYPMLNQCLALPLLPTWTAYLWAAGREQNLITILDEGRGQGFAAWRVFPAPEKWQTIVQDGLHMARIAF